MRQSFLLLAFLLLLIGLSLLSLTCGAKPIALTESYHALFSGQLCSSENCNIIRYARLPRTLAGIFAGIAFGLAGLLMQSLTRNPLADPGILGVNSGAAFAIVLGLSLGGVDNPSHWLLYAFIGALLACLLVALTGAGRGGRINPLRLTLAGVSLAAILEGLTSGISLLNPDIYDHLRFWQIGSLDIRQFDLLQWVTPLILCCVVGALFLAKSLNNLLMGTELATALGTHVGRLQACGLLIIALLAGSATAITGPIAFVGLMSSHIVRALLGNDHRWTLPGVCLFTPGLLLAADIAGRFMGPSEVRVSIVMALIGAPTLIWLVRRQSLGGL